MTGHFRPVREEEVERIAEIAVRAWQPIFGYYREALGEELFASLHTDWEARKAEQVRRAARARRSYEKAGFDRSTSSITYYMSLEER